MSPKLLNILLILIPVMLYYGVFNPLYTGNPGLIWAPESSIAGLQGANVQYANTISLVSEVQAGIKKINGDYKTVEATTTKKIEAMLSDKIDPIKLKKEVITIAEVKGVAINAVTVRDETRFPISGVGSYLVSFSFKARYPTIKALLQEYERSTRFYTIESLSVTRQELKGLSEIEIKNNDTEALQTQVEYRVYYLK